MNFSKAPSGSTNMSSLVGYWDGPYSKLVQVLGKPHYTDGDKTRAEWHLRFEDGTIATVYDYREYCGAERVTEWHIGGFREKALDRVLEILEA